MVSTNPSSPFDLEIFRLGYYAGRGGRRMLRMGPFPGVVQPDPPIGEQRLRECAWEPATSIEIPGDWPSGVYLGKLTARRNGIQSYIIFVVRDFRRADFLFQCSTNTWQAYNRWPSQFSLYDDGVKQWYWGPGVRISYDRPYGKYGQIVDTPLSIGSGEFLLWEFPLAFWMEQEGYDVTYTTNVDTHADGNTLLRVKAFLSVGHDEYWSREMYAHVKTAIDSGVHAAFLCGNSVYGITSLASGTNGQAHRTLGRVGMFSDLDPRYLREWPEMQRFLVFGSGEGLLMGARSVWPIVGAGDWVCARDGHWLFERTRMRNGDGIQGLVGWEFHGAPAEIPGLEMVAMGRTRGRWGEGKHTSVIFPGPRQNLIFNAGTVWWGGGLAEPPGYVRPKGSPRPRGPDRRVQQITRNLFARFVA